MSKKFTFKTLVLLLPFVATQFVGSDSLWAGEFFCTSGNVTCLIAAINEANGNGNGEENTINLAAGTYIVTAVNNTEDGANGLPSVTGNLAITGEGSGTTIIRGTASVLVPFRIFHVAATGTLALDGLSIQGGRVGFASASEASRGAGIFALGALTITNSMIGPNDTAGVGVGGTAVITNSTITGNHPGLIVEGTLTIDSSTISENHFASGSGGGIYLADGIVNVYNSTIRDNTTASQDGGGIRVDAGTMMTLINSTVTANSSLFNAGGIANGGTLTIVNSTVAGNFINPVSSGTAGISSGGTLLLQNTVLASNGGVGGATGRDCAGQVTSLGHNIIGTGCSNALQPSDLTGDPGLAADTQSFPRVVPDDGAPGHGRLPLLPSSPAIDAGDDSACPATDQLGTPRRGTCDIGAVEFYPIVNDLVAVGSLSTAFDATPVPGGPAGTFRMTAEFTNTSNQAIVNPFVEVVELTGGNLLLNADGGAGGVGARVTFSKSESTAFLPGATETFEFVIGLQKQEPFTFFVSLLGDLQTSNSVVGLLRDARASNP